MIGIIKITNNAWNTKSIRRALLKVIKPLKIEEDLYYDLMTIKAESKFFTEKGIENSMLPMYDMVFKSVPKKFLFWKYKRVEFVKCTVVKQSKIIPATPVMNLKQQRDKFLKRN
jgi:hypothetical protein